MGCAFNMYSSSWSDRSYGITLFLYCWILPLFIIFFSYMGMIYDTRTSRKKLVRSMGTSDKSGTEESSEDPRKLKRTLTNDSHHSPHRVSGYIVTELYVVFDNNMISF